MARKNTGLFAELFDFSLHWRCLVYLLLSSQSRMGPKPTADHGHHGQVYGLIFETCYCLIFETSIWFNRMCTL